MFKTDTGVKSSTSHHPFQEGTRTLAPLTLSALTMTGFDGTPLTSPQGGKDCHPGSTASHRIPAGEKLSSLGPEQDPGRQHGPSQRKHLPEEEGDFVLEMEEEKRHQTTMRYRRSPDLVQEGKTRRNPAFRLNFAPSRKLFPVSLPSGSATIPAAPQLPGIPLIPKELPRVPSPTPHASAPPDLAAAAHMAPETQDLNILSQRSWDRWAGTEATAPGLGEPPGTFLYTTPLSIIIISVIS